MEQKEEETREAAKKVSEEFGSLIDEKSLDSMKQSQHMIMGRLQDSNAVLSHFNEYSERCFPMIADDVAKHARVLRNVKSDLEYIFSKLRKVKGKLMETYPDAFVDESTDEADK